MSNKPASQTSSGMAHSCKTGPPFTIEILGVVSANQGANLMLEAVRNWADTLSVEYRLAVRWQTPPEKRRRYGLWTKVWQGKGCPVPYGLVMEYLPGRIINGFRIIRDKDIDLVLDASGFAYGDHSGFGGAKARTGWRIETWKKRGTKVVLLPQAFGPFTCSRLIGEMKRILNFSDLVYARDKRSLEYLRQIYPLGTNLRQCPDITALVDGKEFKEMDFMKGFVGIIPNYKTFSESVRTTREDYLSFLVEVVNLLHDFGKGVVLILHEGFDDERICDEICNASRTPPEIIRREDPLEVKYAIGQCGAVLSSRFHGLANALFQGVPAISTSWSHKYEELASDFGFLEFVLSELNAQKTARQLLSFCDPESRKSLSEMLLRIVAGKQEAVAGMWRQVEKVIQPRFDGQGNFRDE